MDRRHFLSSSLAAGVVSAAMGAEALPEEAKPVTILGISCSPRPGKTTATAIQEALNAAKQVNPRIKTEMIDLGTFAFSGWKDPAPAEDDFNRVILPKLKDAAVAGIIIGSPVYFRNASSLCFAFLERLSVLRTPTLQWADKVAGVLTVGAYRNGGQELVIEQIQAAMLCHEMFLVGGKPGAHQGATLWNNAKDDITKDEFGMESARKLGTRVAQAALKIAGR